MTKNVRETGGGIPLRWRSGWTAINVAMPSPDPSLRAVTAKIPVERLAQLDRLAKRRRTTRARVVREVLEHALDSGEEPLTEAEQSALAERARAAYVRERLAWARAEHQAIRARLRRAGVY